MKLSMVDRSCLPFELQYFSESQNKHARETQYRKSACENRCPFSATLIAEGQAMNSPSASEHADSLTQYIEEGAQRAAQLGG